VGPRFGYLMQVAASVQEFLRLIGNLIGNALFFLESKLFFLPLSRTFLLGNHLKRINFLGLLVLFGFHQFLMFSVSLKIAV
jgi:hypothetical protein